MPQLNRTKEQIESDIQSKTKVCSVCSERKPFFDFYNYKSSVDGKSYRCKPCDTKARDKWSRDSPERSRYSRRNRNLKHQYGVDIPWYDKKIEEQNHRCAICGVEENTCLMPNKRSFAVDHCHESGQVRGLLCNQCNRALGLFKDSVEVLQKAQEYLLKYPRRIKEKV